MKQFAAYLFIPLVLSSFQIRAEAKDLDIFFATGNVSARTEYEQRGENTDDKVWTRFSPYDTVMHIGARFIKTYTSESANGQLGAEVSYFTASAQLPADRIVERFDFLTLLSQNKQPMTSSDRIRFDTGRVTFLLGFSVPLFTDLILFEPSLLAGAGVGRVKDAVTLQTTGRVFDAYPGISAHWGVGLRLRLVLASYLTTSVEYRYIEETGNRPGSKISSNESSMIHANMFLISLGYRFGEK